MSMEDCILYRKIQNDWCVLGYGTTYNECDYDDELFHSLSTVVSFEDLFPYLEQLNVEHITENGICYAGEYVSDPPPEVPQQHRKLCCIPDRFRENK